MRKIIQITACAMPCGENDERRNSAYESLYALCDDGTVWCRSASDGPQGWSQIENVPQEKSKP